MLRTGRPWLSTSQPITRIRAALAAASDVEGVLAEVEIADVLNRRADLSTFLVHLTRGDDPKASLMSILSDGRIRALSPMGWAKDQVPNLGASAEKSQKVVCFSETPLEQNVREYRAPTRQVQTVRPGLHQNGGSTEWRQPRLVHNVMSGQYSTHATSLSALRAAACVDEETFTRHPAASIFPFIESMGTGNRGVPHEFWWEREWRRVGDFVFPDDEIALVLCPEADHHEFETMIPGKVIDPKWSLERMIAKLVGLSVRDVTPFE